MNCSGLCHISEMDPSWCTFIILRTLRSLDFLYLNHLFLINELICNVGGETRGLVCARQVLYLGASPPALLF
jgi:hypothetical protein